MLPPNDTTPSGCEPLSGWETTRAAALVLLAALAGRTLAGSLAAALGGLEVTSGRLDGFVLATGIVLASSVGGVMLFVLLRDRQPSRYLALEPARPSAFAIGLVGSTAIVLLFDGLRWGTTGAVVPLLWRETVASGQSLTLLALAFVVAAPVFEECFFRGLLHRGLERYTFGVPLALTLVPVLFMLAHGPTDALSALEPLVSGGFLGLLRHRTQSLLPGIAAHAFGNAQAILTVLVG